MDDALYRKGLAMALEVLPVAFQYLPCGTITVGHRLELYEAGIGLLYPCTLPMVGRVADVERIVVSDSSHVLLFFDEFYGKLRKDFNGRSSE